MTITDGSGATLWPAGEGGGALGGGDTKQALEAKYDGNMETRLDALLARTIGPEKGRVQVQAELNADQTTQSKLTYANKGTPLQAQSEQRVAERRGRGGGGRRGGTAGNIPSYAAGVGAAGGPSNYKRTKRRNPVRRQQDRSTHTKVAPGTVQQQHVALILDKSVPAAKWPRSNRRSKGRRDRTETRRHDHHQPHRLRQTAGPSRRPPAPGSPATPSTG